MRTSRRAFLGTTAAAGFTAVYPTLNTDAIAAAASIDAPHSDAREFLRAGRAGKIGMVRAYAHYPVLETAGNSASAARGILSDCGVYWMDFILSTTHEAGPRRAFSTGSRKQVAGAPETQVVCYEFESFTAVWEHRSSELRNSQTMQSGCYFYGAHGTLHVGAQGEWEFDNEGFTQDQGQTETLREKCFSKTEIAERALRAKALCKLAMASYELGRAIAWDAARGVCIGDDAASRVLNAV